MSSIYIIANSTDSLDFYTENTATRFIVKLAKPLNLVGRWKVALCEISVFENGVTAGVVGFNCNICNGLMAEGVETQLLRRFKCGRKVHEVFDNLYYVPVEKLFIDTLELYITGSGGNQITLSPRAKVSCTLHLRQDVGL
jgi:hypothetical protein